MPHSAGIQLRHEPADLWSYGTEHAPLKPSHPSPRSVPPCRASLDPRSRYVRTRGRAGAAAAPARASTRPRRDRGTDREWRFCRRYLELAPRTRLVETDCRERACVGPAELAAQARARRYFRHLSGAVWGTHLILRSPRPNHSPTTSRAGYMAGITLSSAAGLTSSPDSKPWAGSGGRRHGNVTPMGCSPSPNNRFAHRFWQTPSASGARSLRSTAASPDPTQARRQDDA